MKDKKILIIVILAILGLSVFFLLNSDKVKRQTAKIMHVEFIPGQHFNIHETAAFVSKDSVYRNFRNKCHFHFQTLGLAKFKDSSYVFLLSEPPPFVHQDSVLAVFKKFNITYEIKTHKIGYDGWIKDMLVCVGRATSENITNLTRQLNKLLYFSDYKAFAIPLPLDTGRIYYSSQKLNYRISLAEINQWFIEDKELFLNLPDTSHTFAVPEIMKTKKIGIFYSKFPGFVIWSINKKEDIQQQKINIRKFTLDADLILGAISDSSMLIIIGRERESSIMELPPLNVETILLLASIKDGELSQSLDINDLLAGKMQNNKDWCPTYLSPQLENTEFGHLLTITDILLKDWSENGTIDYENYPYPKPAYYPFDRPLFSKLGLNELVYNWNTANTMFAYDYDGINLYALNRTGSLPISYFNSMASYISVGHNYENTAYNYFSNLCNTDLIRVVQYTSLYQLFIDNQITCAKDSLHNRVDNKPYLLYKPVKELLTTIMQLTPIEIDSIAVQIAKKNYEKYQHSELMKAMNHWETGNNITLSQDQREEIIRNTKSDNSNTIKSDLTVIQSQLGKMDEKHFDNLCYYLSYPRGQRVSIGMLREIYYLSDKINKILYAIGKPNLHYLGTDLQSVKNYYSLSLKNYSAQWIKIPSLIISYNSPRLTGGHNLSSKIRRVNTINSDKVIVASGRSQDVRQEHQPASSPFETSKPKPKVQPKPNTAPKAPTRPRSEVISSSERTRRGL